MVTRSERGEIMLSLFVEPEIGLLWDVIPGSSHVSGLDRFDRAPLFASFQDGSLRMASHIKGQAQSVKINLDATSHWLHSFLLSVLGMIRVIHFQSMTDSC